MMPELAELAMPTSGMSPRKASGDGGQEEGAAIAEPIGAADAGASGAEADPAGVELGAAGGATTGAAFGLTGDALGDWTTTVGKVTADCANVLPDDSITAKAPTHELPLPRIDYTVPIASSASGPHSMSCAKASYEF